MSGDAVAGARSACNETGVDGMWGMRAPGIALQLYEIAAMQDDA